MIHPQSQIERGVGGSHVTKLMTKRKVFRDLIVRKLQVVDLWRVMSKKSFQKFLFAKLRTSGIELRHDPQVGHCCY